MEHHQNDQTLKADAGKYRPTLVPPQIIEDIAEVREYGVKKYGSEDAWKEVSLRCYKDALCRHLIEYLKDPQSVDEESGIKHYKHVACNLAFICDLEKEIDDITSKASEVDDFLDLFIEAALHAFS